jgi:hypothetical protein
MSEQVPEHTSDSPSVLTRAKGEFDLRRAVWQRAPGDGSAGGIEVAFVDDLVGLRNSARPAGPVLVFTRPEWDAFVAGAQNGEFGL